MTQTSTEAVARIICYWDATGTCHDAYCSHVCAAKRPDEEFFKAASAVLALPDLRPGEEFLEFKEALSDLRSLRHEYECLNGGGPGWSARYKAAWAKVDELFANEDEAAYDRHIESFYG